MRRLIARTAVVLLALIVAWPATSAGAPRRPDHHFNREFVTESLNPDEERQVYRNVNRYWPRALTSASVYSEAVGVETALVYYGRDADFEILFNGRPGGGAPVPGPDLIVRHRRTGLIIIVEAKGRITRAAALSGPRIESGITHQLETSFPWLAQDPARYLDDLRAVAPEAAAGVDAILAGAKYAVHLVGMRTSDGVAVGSNKPPTRRDLLTAIDEIGTHAQVVDVHAVVVQHNLTARDIRPGPSSALKAIDRRRASADPVGATRQAIGVAAAPTARRVGRAPVPRRRPEPGAGAPTRTNGAAAPVMGTDGMTSVTAGLDEPGGIDFSSLELRYVSDVSTDKTRAAGFAFKALPGKGTADRGAGTRAAQRASEAFFVFLALDPRTFTVNLQPGQVDRIVDGKLGRTNAGRVMLEADLRMKKAIAPLIHPDGRVGRRYWSEINRIVGPKSACFTFRQWIVPAEATVYESEGELYILKAPLSVQLEADYLRSRAMPLLLNRCGRVDPALQRRIEAVYRRLILSRVQRAVRRAPEFAALRRVYFSRIAAEWYRERAAARAGGAYADIVGSGDIAPWAPARSWTPRDVFDRYMRSVTGGEFDVKRRVRIGNLVGTRTYVYGGVLFSDVPRRNVSRAELTAMRPGLARRIAGALSQPAVDPQSGEIWLAGASFDRTAAASDPAFGSRDSADDGPDIGAPLVAFLVALGSALLVLVTRRVMRRPR